LGCASPLALSNTRPINYHIGMRPLGILLSSLTALFVFAVRQLPAQETHTNSGLHCLWKAKGESNTVYFLGSIHELRETDYPLPQVIESAFTNCQIAVFEVDISKALDSNTLAVLRPKSWLPAGTSLRELLPASVYVSFSNHVDEVGMSMAKSFDSLKPVMAVEKLKLAKFKRFGAYFDYGVDKHFAKLAQESGRQIIGLETVDLEIDLLASFSESEQELVVERFLSNADNVEKQFNDLVLAWKNGDSSRLCQIVSKQPENVPTVYKKIVTDRNANWMPDIKRLLRDSQNAIVIVGVGHLVGPDGIIESLKKQGVAITQL
jgi:uncharacterized protein YbaP (TraB family)